MCCYSNENVFRKIAYPNCWYNFQQTERKQIIARWPYFQVLLYIYDGYTPINRRQHVITLQPNWINYYANIVIVIVVGIIKRALFCFRVTVCVCVCLLLKNTVLYSYFCIYYSNGLGKGGQ